MERVSLCAGADESVRLAEGYVKEHLSKLLTQQPEIIEGPTGLNKVSADALALILLAVSVSESTNESADSNNGMLNV
jgi:hypothetical protein